MNFTPPTLEQVKLTAAKICLPEIEAEKFQNYYSSVNWVVGRNKKMTSWTHALAGWKLRWQENDNRRQQISPSAQAILWQRELDRIETRISTIRAGYSENLEMTQKDRKEISGLKERQKELIQKLGMTL